jgi:hypothetical protein
MTEENNAKIEPLNEEELSALIAKLEEEGDFTSELSRALFTILVVGFEYQQLYATLQAYYAAAAAACADTAGACSEIIGIKDVKKKQKMYKVASHMAGNIPARATAILAQEQDNNDAEPVETEETNESTAE